MTRHRSSAARIALWLAPFVTGAQAFPLEAWAASPEDIRRGTADHWAFTAPKRTPLPTVGGPSVRPPLPAGVAALGYANSVKWKESDAPEKYRRGLYIFFQRTVPYPMLLTFDCPDSNVANVRRARSNTPLQALTLLNDPVFVECAQWLARRILTHGAATDDVQRLRHAFRLCLARVPTDNEIDELLALLRDQRVFFQADPDRAARLVGGSSLASTDATEAAAWIALSRTLLNLDEFVTRE